MRRADVSLSRRVVIALFAYALASLFHHVHNAVFLPAYPNMPEGLSVFGVYAAWLVVTSIGVLGYMLWRAGYRRPALLTLAVYGACGLDGLAHYVVAEFTAHTFLMHVSILTEAILGVVLILACVQAALRLSSHRARV